MTTQYQGSALQTAVNKSNSKTTTPSSGQGYSIGNPSGGGFEVSPTGKVTIIPKKSRDGRGGGGGSGIVPSTSSPTGYTDTLNQPVSVMPKQANSLSNQFKGSSIQPVKDYGFVKPYQQSFGSSLKQTGKNVLYNVGVAFGDRDREYVDTFEPLSRYGTFNVKNFLFNNINKPDSFSFFETRETSFTKSKEKQMPIIKEEENIISNLNTQSNDYATNLSSFGQSKYDTGFNYAQSNINTGNWSLSQGKDYLSKLGVSIESESKIKLEDYNKQLNKQFETSIGSLEDKRASARKSVYSGQIGLGTVAKIGIEIGALSLGGSNLALAKLGGETGLSLGNIVTLGFGAKEIVMGGKEQDIFRTVGGVGIVGFTGISKFSLTAKEISASEDIGSLSKKSFKFGEQRFVSEASDFSLVKGVRSAGGLNQEINVMGKVLKNDEFFIQPNSKFVSQVGGEIDSSWGGGLFGVKPQTFVGVQTGQIGSKGFSLPIGESGNFATFGKGNMITQFESYGTTNLNKIKQPNIISYHGTTDIYKSEILTKGLSSGTDTGISQRIGGFKLGEVYTTPSKEWASGWANMATFGKGSKVGNPQVFEVVMPKSTFESSLISRGIEKGGSEEFVFKSINPKYIKGSGSFNPIEYSFDSNKLIKSFNKNIKLNENEYTSSYFAGVSKKIGNDFYLSRSGKITGMELNPTRNIGDLKLTREGLRIDANLKDWTLTKIIPKSSVKGSMEIDFTNTKSGLQGLTSLPKQSFQGSGLITQSAIQEFKQNLVPKLMTKSSSFITKGLGVSGAGLSSIQIGKTKSVYATGLSSASLGLSSTSGLKFKTSQLTGLSSSFKQPSAQMSGLSQLQLTKLDLGLKQISPQLSLGNISPTPFGGFGGFGSFGGWGFPPFALPSFGGGLGYVKPKRKGKRKKTKIKPSLTASLFNIRGSLPKGGAFGISPFQLRKIPRGNPYATSF